MYTTRFDTTTRPLAAELVVSVGRRSLVELEQVLQVLRGKGVHLDHHKKGKKKRFKTKSNKIKSHIISETYAHDLFNCDSEYPSWLLSGMRVTG